MCAKTPASLLLLASCPVIFLICPSSLLMSPFSASIEFLRDRHKVSNAYTITESGAAELPFLQSVLKMQVFLTSHRRSILYYLVSKRYYSNSYGTLFGFPMKRQPSLIFKIKIENDFHIFIFCPLSSLLIRLTCDCFKIKNFFPLLAAASSSVCHDVGPYVCYKRIKRDK